MAPPANAGDVVHSPPGTDAYLRHDTSPLDRKAREPPSYAPPPLYSQTHQPQQDVKVALPFREHHNNAELPPIQTSPPRERNDTRHKQLPSISSVTGQADPLPTASASASALDQPSAAASSSSSSAVTNHWPSLNPLTAYYTPGHAQSAADSPLRMDIDSSSTSTGPTGATSPDRYLDTRAGSVSLDDPDVRLAAEALGDLRADFVSSPPARSSTLPPRSSPNPSNTSEPLLSLLTTSHPLLEKAIEGTTSAYNTSKNFSPRFKTGAEYVEGYLTPIGNTIGSVSRVTGVEGGVRWFLSGGRRRGHQHPSSSEEGESSKPSFYKRRKVDLRRSRASSGAAGESQLTATASKSVGTETPLRSELAAAEAGAGDGYDFNEDRRLSMSTVETLPAYDDARSPAYTESVDGSMMQLEATSSDGNSASRQQVSGQPAAWQTRLIMSTSGLSVAMSAESLRSLKYCLNWLRWANGNIDKVIVSLKTALDQYDTVHGGSDGSGEATGDSGQQAGGSGNDATVNVDSNDNGTSTSNNDNRDDAATQAERNELAARIATLRGDLLQTLRGAVDTVSKYAGGALPDNARVLVRRHLTSLPQRFRLANQAEASAAEQAGGRPATDKDVREGAQRVLVLAKEGLDMMSQVSGVLDGTIVSAEEWCERLGKKKPRDDDDQPMPIDQQQQPAIAAAAGSLPPPPMEADGDVVMQ